jgi:signal transduction histidine kinase
LEREKYTVRRLPAVRSTSGARGETGPYAWPGVEKSVGRRIMRELHDTVKQNLCGATMLIEACLEAQVGNGHPSRVRELLDRALEMSREAERQLSEPLEALGASCEQDAPAYFLEERFEGFGRYFGIKTHTSLEAPLESLSRSQLAVAQQIYAEALWNAIRHSGAENLWLESRLSGDAFELALLDDGRGFRADEVAGGLGLESMRSRAEEIDAAFEILSAPAEGTTVRLRLPVPHGDHKDRG